MNETSIVKLSHQLYRYLAYQTGSKPDLSEWIILQALSTLAPDETMYQ